MALLVIGSALITVLSFSFMMGQFGVFQILMLALLLLLVVGFVELNLRFNPKVLNVVNPKKLTMRGSIGLVVCAGAVLLQIYFIQSGSTVDSSSGGRSRGGLDRFVALGTLASLFSIYLGLRSKVALKSSPPVSETEIR
jgi:hypothetical protein